MQPDPRDYEIRIWYSAEKGDECFIAQVVEWPGIMTHGATREEAARQIQLALEGALEVAAEKGIKPPAPALAHAVMVSLRRNSWNLFNPSAGENLTSYF